MSHVTGAHHIGITVRSLERSLEFYRDLLGLEPVFTWNPRAPYIGELVGYPEVDLHAVVLRVPGTDSYLELLEYRNVSAEPSDAANGRAATLHVAFAINDLDEFYHTLRANGVAAVSAPVTPTIGPNEGGRAVYMIDPDGVRVELIQSAQSFGAFAAEGD